MEKRIAVVNDEPDFVHMVTLILEEEGYEIRSCDNGASALALMREWQPNLVLLDIRMRGLSGWQILDQMQRDPNLAGVRVLVTSGASEEVAEARERLQGSGHDFLALPFDIDEFVNKVKDMAG